MGVIRHEYKVGLIYGLVSCCVTMALSIVIESEYTFHEAVSFSLSQFGLSGVSLKEEQHSAVRAVYEGQDVFVCLPTGYGRACATKRFLF